MILFTLLLINLFWMLYSLTEGVREGFYWHYENKCKRICDFDVNPMFHFQRLLVIFVSGGFLFHTVGWYSVLSLLSMSLMFIFFHNGAYYYTRNKLDHNMYKNGWKDESATIPRLSILMKNKIRTLLMILGVLSQIFIYLFLLV